MKKEKMSFDKMKKALGTVLNREEMKKIMAGSGTCGSCFTQGVGQTPCIDGLFGPGCYCQGSGAFC